MLTLRECGLNGNPLETKLNADGRVDFDEKSIPVIQVFYDFRPAHGDDAVLLYFRKV